MRFVVFKANVQTLFIKYKYKQNKVTRKHTRKKKAERAEHTACYNDIGTKKNSSGNPFGSGGIIH